jgi:hypothetical protein
MANNLNLTATALDRYLGKPIEKICPLGFGRIGDPHFHCAHFVGHVLSLNHRANVGATCAVMVYGGWKRRGSSACIRVNELFNRCSDLAGPDEKGCLAYITMKSNLRSRGGNFTMGSDARKHVGIYLGGQVWHYGNLKDKVKKQSLEDFSKHYSGDAVVRFTRFPKRAKFVP